jgi:ferritin-like metal-binding protein YciE
MDLNSLRDAFHEQLKDMYSAEKQLTEALPKMAEAASSERLRNIISDHLRITKTQLERVQQMLDASNVNPGSKVCKAMQGLIEEGSEVAKMQGHPTARDAALIGAAQKVEHYEIATYGTLRSWALMLGEERMANMLQDILDEEYEADNALDRLAEGALNQRAV